jgi:TrmH family RNA methyltransferase
VIEVSGSELERLSSLSTPNQVVGVFEKPSFPSPVFNGTISLVLDGIQDPGNLGTIVRIADWFGISRVWCSRDSADVFNAKAVQSTMGSISRVQVLYGDPGDLVREYPALPVYAAVLEGKDLYGQERITEGLIVIGNESRGIREGWLGSPARAITIPRIGQAESLNAAVATGIILSHLVGG